jgi:hypothetical protein
MRDANNRFARAVDRLSAALIAVSNVPILDR